MPTWNQKYLNYFYFDKPDWIDGTTQFHQLCKEHIRSGERILDLGAGVDNPTSNYLRTISNHLVGIDCTHDIEKNPWPKYSVIYDGTSIPIRSGHFDAVVSNYTVEHLEHPTIVFTEVARVLRPGGKFIFRTPNRYHYISLASLFIPYYIRKNLANWLRRIPQGGLAIFPTFYRANTRKTLENISNYCGFDILQFIIIEKEPSYGMRIRPLFLLQMSYERLVNRYEWLSMIRSTILFVASKGK